MVKTPAYIIRHCRQVMMLVGFVICLGPLAYGQMSSVDSLNWYKNEMNAILGSDYARTIQYNRRVIALSEETGDTLSALIYSAKLSYYLTYDGHYEEARALAYSLLKKLEQNPDDKLDALVHKALAFYHRLSGNLDIAQAYYDQALSSALRTKDNKLITDLRIEMSKMEFTLERYQKSLQIAQEVLSQKDLTALDSANAGQMIGLCYESLGNTDAFIESIDQYVPVLRSVNPEGEWKAADLLAKKYKTLNLSSARKKELQRLLDISAAIGNREAKSFYKMGDYYADNDQVDEAIKWHKKALDYARKTDRTSDELTSLKSLYRDYKQTSKSDSTLYYYEQYVDLRNLFFERQSQDRIIDRDQNLALQEKETEILKLSESKRKSDERTRFLIFALLSLAVLTGIAFFAYNRIKTISENLKNTNKELRRSYEENSTLLKETHHRIKNNLQVISSLINLQRRYVNDESARQALLDGRNRIKSVSLVHELLYSYDIDEGVNMHDYIDKISAGLWSSYKVDSQHIKFINDVEPMYLVEENVNSIGLVVNEMMTNALKHAFPNQRSGAISVSLKEEKNRLELLISDDGIGLPDHFDLSKDSNTFGHSLLQSIAKKMNATLEITGVEGTQVHMSIQKYTRLEGLKRRKE